MAHASGKYSKSISDRSGMEFPYKEMVKEWNGSFVHKSEFEAKHPQLERQKHAADAQSIKDGRPDRLEPVTVFIGGAGFFEYNNSMQINNKKPPFIGLTVGKVTVSTS
jgi:sulfur carrier protein ThiS